MKNIPIENLNEKKQTLKTPIKNDIDLIDTMKENENDENLKNLIEKNTKESNKEEIKKERGVCFGCIIF
jgi:RNA polymerase-binding transcription factor DksA